MSINAIATAIRNSMCDAFVDAYDTGSTDAGGDYDVKIVHKPVSINGVTDENEMAQTILDANPNIDSVYLQWL